MDLTGAGPERPRPFPGETSPTGEEPEAGIVPTGKASNLYLVDGAGGAGTIYAYNYELREIITSFPTPEAADRVYADALAYASDRGTLFYTNSNGTGLIYELDPETGVVIGVPFDGLVASGGHPITGMGYGNITIPGTCHGGTGPGLSCRRDWHCPGGGARCTGPPTGGVGLYLAST